MFNQTNQANSLATNPSEPVSTTEQFKFQPSKDSENQTSQVSCLSGNFKFLESWNLPRKFYGSTKYRPENELNSLMTSDASNSSTDLSLKSKPQTAGTSVGASDEKSSLGYGSSSGRMVDDGSGTESSSGENSARNIETTPVAVRRSRIIRKASKEESSRYLPVLQLSTANMKKHDLEQALMIPHENPKLAYIGNGSLKRNKSSESLNWKGRNGRKSVKVKLPTVYSSLNRSFPLPKPQDIEVYSQEPDNVFLESRASDSATSLSPEFSSNEN